MSKFKIGNKIRCIDNSNPPVPLKLQGLYIAQGKDICSCGLVSYDVGIIKENIRLECPCGIKTTGSNVWYLKESRFESAEEEDLQQQIEKAIQEENYELAHELKLKLDGKDTYNSGS